MCSNAVRFCTLHVVVFTVFTCSYSTKHGKPTKLKMLMTLIPVYLVSVRICAMKHGSVNFAAQVMSWNFSCLSGFHTASCGESAMDTGNSNLFITRAWWVLIICRCTELCPMVLFQRKSPCVINMFNISTN